MEAILDSILTADFWGGFVGALCATAFLVQALMIGLRAALHREIPTRFAVLLAIPAGILVAWAWASASDGKLVLGALLRDGLVNAASSTVAYENVIKPWLKKKAGI